MNVLNGSLVHAGYIATQVIVVICAEFEQGNGFVYVCLLLLFKSFESVGPEFIFFQRQLGMYI